IVKECMPFLKESENRSLYRGMKGLVDSVKQISPRSNRKPLDTKKSHHDIINVEFAKKYNVDNIRSRAVFCTGHTDNAIAFGTLYNIFPIGDYSYWWSDAVLDINYSRKWADHTKSRFFDKDAEDIWFPLYPKAGSFWVYYKWAEGLFKSPEVDELIYPSIVEFIKWANYKNIDLVSAIKSGVEIMFICNSYWAVPDSH
ncbi:MAG TPA: hypothetical protein VI775_02505, partial [Candidatus Paceibacterota bacterium]